LGPRAASDVREAVNGLPFFPSSLLRFSPRDSARPSARAA
jgi:hypothetical protein